MDGGGGEVLRVERAISEYSDVTKKKNQSLNWLNSPSKCNMSPEC